MKNIFKIGLGTFLLLGVASCNTDDENYPEIISIDKVAIDSIEILSDSMNVGEVQSIRTYSTYASGCQDFYDYDYQAQNFTRNVTAYSFTHNGNCTQAQHTEMSQLVFQPQTPGTYYFNFWKNDNTVIKDSIVVEL